MKLILMLIFFTSVMLNAQAIETEYWYKIHNEYLGNTYSLSVKKNADHNPIMDSTKNEKNQNWKFIKEHGEYYRIMNEAVGEYRSFDNYLDGNNEPFLGKTGIFDAQFWLIHDTDSSGFQFTNMLLGDGKALSVDTSNIVNTIMSEKEIIPFQIWRIEKVKLINNSD